MKKRDLTGFVLKLYIYSHPASCGSNGPTPVVDGNPTALAFGLCCCQGVKKTALAYVSL
jgi:hypothetical protein